MFFLPKANPLYENISAQKVVITEVLDKLGKGSFTGYLDHSSPGFESCCIFVKGKLISVVSNDSGRSKTDIEGISLLFNKIITFGGDINVYRMTSNIAMCSHALVVGTKVLEDNEVRQVDVKRMLLQLKNQEFNGVVHFYTKERSAMIFYMNGQPFGFYDNDSKAIGTSPETSRQVAALPGARLSINGTKPVEELMHHDLLQMVNLAKLWEAELARNSMTAQKVRKLDVIEPFSNNDEKLHDLIEDLAEVAMAYLSREGRGIVEKRLQDIGGPEMLYDQVKIDSFLESLAKDAQEIDSQARIEEMIDLMRSEITGRLSV